MENNKEIYKCDFDVWREGMEVWKERDANHLSTIISVCRLGGYMRWDGYGTATFEEGDEEDRWHPIIEKLEGHNRKFANILIYSLDVEGSPWTKVFIYYNTSKVKGHAGYYIYNSEDPSKHIHKYYMDNDMNRVMLSLNKVINGIRLKATGNEGRHHFE